MCSGSWVRGKSSAPASGNMGTRKAVEAGTGCSGEEERGEPAALCRRPGILQADHLEQLQQPLARRRIVPFAVARHDLEQLVGGAVTVAARHQYAGKLEAGLVIVGIGGDSRVERTGVDIRFGDLGEIDRRL